MGTRSNESHFLSNLSVFRENSKSYFNSKPLFTCLNPLNKLDCFWSRNILLVDEIEKGGNGTQKKKPKIGKGDYLEQKRKRIFSMRRKGLKNYRSYSPRKKDKKKLKLFSSKYKRAYNNAGEKISVRRKRENVNKINDMIKKVRKTASKPMVMELKSSRNSPVKIKKSKSFWDKQKSTTRVEVEVDCPNELDEDLKYVSLISERNNKKKEEKGLFSERQKAKEKLNKYFMHKSRKKNDAQIKEILTIQREYDKLEVPLLKQVKDTAIKFNNLEKVT